MPVVPNRSTAAPGTDPSAARNAAREAARARASVARDAQPTQSREEFLAERRKRLEARYASSRAAQSPQDAGIPLGKGQVSARNQRAQPSRPARAAAKTAQPPEALAAAPQTAPGAAVLPTGLVLMKTGQPAADPLDNELVRSGQGFVFKGRLNGKPVQFRLTENANGLIVPAAIAVTHGIISPTSPAVQPGAEMFTPVQSIAVGSHPVTAVMAKVISSKSPYVEVGVDALQAFKVVVENGRRLLVPNPS